MPPARPSELGPVIAEDQNYQASDACACDRGFWCARLKEVPAPPLLAPAKPVAHGVRLDVEANPDSYDSDKPATLHASLLTTLDLLADSARDERLPLEATLGAAAKAAATPDKIAVRQDCATLTYVELLARVQKLAARLLACGRCSGLRDLHFRFHRAT